MKRHYKFVLIFVPMALLISCAEMRKVTYPPNFVYIEKSDVKNTMSVFAENIFEIDRVLQGAKSDKEIDRSRIIAAMDSILSAASHLDQEKTETNHRVIDHNLDIFRQSVQQARQMAQKTPPNYYLAGQLAGQCMACHKLRRP
ncbi:MAG: hypothetical protein KDD61_10025 [Bdellovibrionales bacterium]|nr:hypothetical protein [Bdellovibrionales bacterium]